MSSDNLLTEEQLKEIGEDLARLMPNDFANDERDYPKVALYLYRLKSDLGEPIYSHLVLDALKLSGRKFNERVITDLECITNTIRWLHNGLDKEKERPFTNTG